MMKKIPKISIPQFPVFKVMGTNKLVRPYRMNIAQARLLGLERVRKRLFG